MPAITITCVSPPAFVREPRLTIPNLGVLVEAYDQLSRIPDPGELVAKLMNKAMLALAPLRKYLQLVEAIIAIKQCIEAIPRALLPPSPGPIIECFKALIKTIAALIQDIPPFPYIQTVIDLCRIMVQLIDLVLTLVARLDQKISALLTLRNYANALGDTTLLGFANCGLMQAKLPLMQTLSLLTLFAPILNVLLSVILRLIPSPEAQKAANECLAAASSFSSAVDQLDAIDPSVVGFPKLTSTLAGLGVTREALVLIESILAPICGEAAQLTSRSMPTFQIF